MQPLAVLSALGRQFIEQNQRLQNCINFDESTTMEPAQRRSVLDGSGIGNPRGQDRPLFRRCQLRIAGDVNGMSVDRRSIRRRRRSVG